MQEESLKNFDSDDVGDVLREIEISFAIKFGKSELSHVTTFGELCEVINGKIQLTDCRDCTSQQAFYKLKRAFGTSTVAHAITPDSNMAVLLPRANRKKIWRSVEQQLGFKLGIIGASSTVVSILLVAFAASLASFLFSAKVAGIGLLISSLAALIAGKTGKTVHVQTVRECIEKMTSENYSKSRRNPTTFNRTEIDKQVLAIFMDDLDLPASALTREATFV